MRCGCFLVTVLTAACGPESEANDWCDAVTATTPVIANELSAVTPVIAVVADLNASRRCGVIGC